MSPLQIGCQTYAWQMSGKRYLGRLDHIIQTVGSAGFSGIETEVQFLVGESRDHAYIKSLLQAQNLQLAAITLVEDWLHPQETDAERSHANWTLDFLAHFPETLLVLCQMPGADRANLKERQSNLLSCVNRIAQRAHGLGITCTYHPNSPVGSVFRTREDYEILLAGLDPKVIGYTPDVGHIANGEMDPLSILKTYAKRINHVHFKDRATDGAWAAMGKGVIDFSGIMSLLNASGYTGWVIVEDECDDAMYDPDRITMEDGLYRMEKLQVGV